MTLFFGIGSAAYVLLLRIVPLAVTIVLAYTPPHSHTEGVNESLRRRGLALILVLSCSFHFFVYLFLHRLFLHSFNFFATAKRIVTFQYSYQDIAYVPLSLTVSLILGVALGWLLRLVLPILFFGDPIHRRLQAGRKIFLAAVFVVFLFSVVLFYDCSRSGQSHIVINEIGGNNCSYFFDDSENTYDYIELFNTGRLSCSLQELYLSDDETDLQKLCLPNDTILPGGYYLIKLDGSSFAVNKGGKESIILSDKRGAYIDIAATLPMVPDIATARETDGSSVWGTFTATPERSNAESFASIDPSRRTSARLTVSHPSGFYEDAFYLTISAEPGYDIYYTLDGSEPTQSSLHYTAPLLISDASANPNVHSVRDDLSTGFYTQDIADAGFDPPEYKIPDYPVDKCTILRAVGIRPDGAASESTTQTYFVGIGDRPAYKNMNVLSIVCPPYNLFDYYYGIYVTGALYDEYRSGSLGSFWWDPYWWWWSANYRLHGKAAERNAHLMFFSADQTLRLEQDAGIRIQGGGSRGCLPRSFNFYARKLYDGHDLFQNALFGNSYLPKRVTLSSGGDDNQYKLRDYLISSLAAERNFATMEFEPYVLFLDGEYWGNYWLTEKYDAEYLAYHYGIDPNDAVMIKDSLDDLVEVGSPEDLALYTDCLEAIESADLSVPENYEMACSLMDVDSLIDYFACEVYIARYGDWPDGNFALWRSRTANGPGYADGKWRWMLYDVNGACMENDMVQTDIVPQTMAASPLFTSFMANETFRERFAAALLELADTVFLPEKVDAVIDGYQELMAAPLNAEHQRFYGTESTDWEEYIADIRRFFHTRYAYIKASLSDFDTTEWVLTK